MLLIQYLVMLNMFINTAPKIKLLHFLLLNVLSEFERIHNSISQKKGCLASQFMSARRLSLRITSPQFWFTPWGSPGYHFT